MVNFNPIDKAYIVSWQSDLVNTKESVLPVFHKPYNTNKNTTEMEGDLRNYAMELLCSF